MPVSSRQSSAGVLRLRYLSIWVVESDGNEAVVPYAYFSVTGKKNVDETSEAMARSFPVDYIFPMGGKEPEALGGDPKGTSYSTSVDGTIYHEASVRGIPGALCEIGRDGKIEKDLVEKHYTGVLNAMRYLGMMERKPNINNRFHSCKMLS